MSKLQYFFLFSIMASCVAIFSCGDNEDDTFFPDAPVNPDQAKLVQLVNDARLGGKNCGGSNLPVVTAITWNDTLALVARKHSQDMAANDKLSHNGSNGSFPDERIIAEGYIPLFQNENIAKGGPTEEEVIQIWLNSAAHCINIMDSRVKEMGIGTSGPYWTMVMASH